MSEFEQVSEGGNSQGLFGSGNQLQGGTGPAGGMSGTGFAEADGVRGTGAAAYGASVDTRGPFSPQLNGMLSASFGSSLQGLQLKRGEGTKNQKIGALAHTIGNRISLGDHITEDPKDAHSMEVISHEVAHALAGGGQGKHPLDRPGDPGETAAYDAGRKFKAFVAGGAKEAPPQLSPARGGLAAIHRFEGGEHKDAVDNAEKTLKEEGIAVDKDVTAQMGKTITLGNGLEVTPGDITAMMGDFYGAFDKGKDGKDHFNPAKSFEAMNNADPEEMKQILARIKREKEDVEKTKEGKGEFKATPTSEFDQVTENRKVTTDKDGTTTGYNFLELAKRNANHFNKQDTTGFDNNMGSYDEFHRMALEAAAKGDENRARGLEASAQHFLTDRFSAGHQFDKDKIIEAGGGGTGGQIMTRFVHNQLDKNGVKMTDASGTSWDGRGDEHWGEKENKENRKHAAQATYQSYSELEDVLSKKKKPEEALKGSKVSGMVPQWSPDNEKRAEESAKMKGMDDPVAFAKFLKNEGGDMLEEKTHELKKWAGDKWDGAKSWLGDKWHKASSWLGNKWDGAKEWASEKWEGAKDWAGDKWQGAKDWASDKYQGAKDWLGDKWQGTKDWAGEKWQGAKQSASDAVDWGKDKAGAAKQWAGEKWQSTKDWAGEKWQGAKESASNAVEWGKEKAGEAKQWAGDKWQGAKESASDAVEWGKEKAGEAKQWAGNKWEGAKESAGAAKNWASDKASSVWNWAKRKASGD